LFHYSIRQFAINTFLISAPAIAQDFLEAVVVTGSRYQEYLKNTPVRTEIIDREILQNRGIRSLAEAVEYSPGIRVETTCQNCNQQAIQMLGLPQQYIGILNDSLPNFSALAGVYGIEQIPAGLIGQIEIVKGGGSVLYGPGAVAGVINLIPRDPQKTGGQFSLDSKIMPGNTFGQEPGGSFFGLYDHVSQDGSFKATFFGGFDRIQPTDLAGDGFTDVSERSLLNGGLRLVWNANPAHKFSLDYFTSDEERLGGDIKIFGRPTNTGLIAEEIFSQRHVATAKWIANWNELFNTSFAYSYSRTNRNSYYGGTVALGSPDPNSLYFDPTWTNDRGYGSTIDNLHFIETTANWTLNERHRITFGSQWKYEDIRDVQLSANRAIDSSFNNLGLLAQHRYTPNEKITFEYGARFDVHSEVDNPIFSPRAALLYSATDQFRLRTAISTGFRAPEVFDEDLHISNVGGELFTTFNDPALQEESSLTASISPEWDLNDNWRLELNGFHTWLDNTLVVEPNDLPSTPNVREFLRTNGESSRIFGAELNLAYDQPLWRLEFSWVEQHLEYDDSQLLLGDDTFSDPADNPILSDRYTKTPNSLGLIRFTHEALWFDWFITAKLTGPMDVPRVISDPANGNLLENRLEKSDWFFNVDLGFSKIFELSNGKLTGSLGVRNLLDDFQNDLETGAFRDSDYVAGPAFPRSFYAGFKYEF
jgi:outer membrane receptor for ferrienterochelin and colicins